MAIDDQPVAFNRAGAERIVRATKTLENQYRLPPPQGGRYSGGRGAGCVVAKTGVSGITALLGSKAGSGDVTLYDMDEDGDLIATGVTLKCWNIGGEIGGNKFILVDFGTRGPWAIVVPCS